MYRWDTRAAMENPRRVIDGGKEGDAFLGNPRRGLGDDVGLGVALPSKPSPEQHNALLFNADEATTSIGNMARLSSLPSNQRRWDGSLRHDHIRNLLLEKASSGLALSGNKCPSNEQTEGRKITYPPQPHSGRNSHHHDSNVVGNVGVSLLRPENDNSRHAVWADFRGREYVSPNEKLYSNFVEQHQEKASSQGLSTHVLPTMAMANRSFLLTRSTPLSEKNKAQAIHKDINTLEKKIGQERGFSEKQVLVSNASNSQADLKTCKNFMALVDAAALQAKHTKSQAEEQKMPCINKRKTWHSPDQGEEASHTKCDGANSAEAPYPRADKACEELSPEFKMLSAELQTRAGVKNLSGHNGSKPQSKAERTVPLIDSVSQEIPVSLSIIKRRKGVVNHTYRDFSRISPEVVARVYGASHKDRVPFFTKTMYEILSIPKYRGCIHWMPHGRAFRVSVPKEFEKKCLTKYFGHSRYSTFLQQLRHHGFKCITGGRDRNCFYHEAFLRKLPHLLCYMPEPKESRRLAPDPANEPNLYRITELYPVPVDPLDCTEQFVGPPTKDEDSCTNEIETSAVTSESESNGKSRSKEIAAAASIVQAEVLASHTQSSVSQAAAAYHACKLDFAEASVSRAAAAAARACGAPSISAAVKNSYGSLWSNQQLDTARQLMIYQHQDRIGTMASSPHISLPTGSRGFNSFGLSNRTMRTVSSTLPASQGLPLNTSCWGRSSLTNIYGKEMNQPQNP